MGREKVIVRQVNVYDSDLVSAETALECKDPTRTKQEFKDEADINVLVGKYGLLGAMPKEHRTAIYQDFDGPFDYHGAQTRIAEAREAFMDMPPDIRSRFGNDPQALMEFIADEQNRPEVKRMGLLTPEEAAERPIMVRVMPEPQPVNPKPEATSERKED